MNVKNYTRRNRVTRIKNRLLHPPPFYKKVGGISAIVTRADGTKENLGNIADTYAKRWNVGSGQ